MRFIIGLLFIIFTISPVQAVSGNDLIENAHKYDNQRVAFQGEAIGDIMARGNHAWVNVNDGERAIGIWAKISLTDKITHTGSYRFTGDQVKIVGTFHRACPQHGGDLDIHADEMSVLKIGERIAHPIVWSKITIVIALLIGIIILMVYPLIYRRR